MDETGVSLLPFSKRGRAQAGVSEVLWHGWDEKRQFTITPIINGEGELVQPTQMIWGGTEYKKGTEKKERLYGATAHASGNVAEECKEYLYHEQTESHWCTIGSLKQFVINLYAHVCDVCEALSLDAAAQTFILVLDCYSVHTGQEFLEWCSQEFPTLLLLFIPANCTAWLQPLDISFNGPFKRMLRQLAGEWLAEHMRQQLLICKDPTKVRLNVTLKALRPHFTRWVAKALAAVSEMKCAMMRGWEESQMAEGMRLAAKGRVTEEFKMAEQMEKNGTLFQKYTMKKAAELAEELLSAQHQRFLSDEFRNGDLNSAECAAEIEHGPAGIIRSPADVRDGDFTMDELEQLDDMQWHQPEYAGAITTVQHHVGLN